MIPRLRLPAVLTRDSTLAALVGVATVLLLATTASQGFVRDEGYYFRAAREYFGWFELLWDEPTLAFSDAALTRAFGYNTEHPGLVKILSGFTWRVAHGLLGTSQAAGFRLAAQLLTAVGAVFTYLLGARLFSRGVGLLAVALLFACPHVFYHAHLACFDAPVMALTVVTTYAFWRSLSSPRWIVLAGVAWGLALATKHNAVFVPPTLLLAWLFARAGDFRLRHGGVKLPALPLAFLSMLLIGPLVLYLFYPYGWHAPLARLGGYFAYHLHHEHYPVEYFGQLYTAPPFPISYPFVMSGITIPLPVLAPGLLGLALWTVQGLGASRRAILRMAPPVRPAIDTWLMVLSAVVPPAIIALPSVPIFGGTKHWMSMLPFLALLAAWVIVEAARRLTTLLPQGRVLAAVMIAASIALPAIETARTHPYGHTYFNEVVGGHQGAARLGMPRTFWGGDARGLLPILNEHAAAGARIFPHRMNLDSFRAYQDDGLLRGDLRFTGDLRQADWAFINHQREYQDAEYKVWALTDHGRPRASIMFDGVPIVSLYALSPSR